MDGFQVRLQLVSILRKLSSSQNSIQSTVRFLLKHKDKYGEDLWDCLIEEAEKVNLNARINILYLIDGLLFTSSTALLTSYHQDYQHVHKKPRTLSPAKQSHHPTTSTIASSSSSSGPQTASFNYGYLIKKDIIRLVEIVVPTSFKKKGLLNFMSTAQVLKNWKAQVALIDQFLDAALLDRIHQLLNERKQILGQPETDGNQDDLLAFSKKEIMDRIDDDRERHKRLRERIWVLPIPSIASLSPKLGTVPHPASPYTHHRSATLLHTSLLASASSSTSESSSTAAGIVGAGAVAAGPHVEFDLTISLECDQLLLANAEDTADEGLEDSDWDAIRADRRRCFRHLFPPLDLPGSIHNTLLASHPSD